MHTYPRGKTGCG